MNLLILLLWFAACADQDARHRRVSNVLTLGGAALALVYLLMNGSTWLGASMTEARWAVLWALLLTLPGYALKKLGAGDAKLLVTVALTSDQLHVLGTFVGAGFTSLMWLLLRQKIWPHLAQGVRNRYPQLAPEPSNKQPFVPFLFTGFLMTTLCLS
ncbi:prepilin peptidase [Pseudomonas sp. NPDC088444]|uniref:prepilin peptidase n=1 Tax=Pseudomonas sp. NPDC088444 TaxID=3364456 RepID=UPI00384A5E46